jgi:hypothetical protein
MHATGRQRMMMASPDQIMEIIRQNCRVEAPQ